MPAWIEACNEASEAENTARVLDQNLVAADDAMVRSLEDRRYRFYDLNVNLSVEDQKRLADELDDAYGDVARATSAYSLQFARAREEHVFAQYDDVQLACAREKLARGRWALLELTQVPVTALPDLEARERGCEIEQVELAAEQYYDDFVHPHPEHAPDLHPHSNATDVDLSDDQRSATVNLEDAGGKPLGRLSLVDEGPQDTWHVEDVIGNLEKVEVPRAAPDERAASQ